MNLYEKMRKIGIKWRLYYFKHADSEEKRKNNGLHMVPMKADVNSMEAVKRRQNDFRRYVRLCGWLIVFSLFVSSVCAEGVVCSQTTNLGGGRHQLILGDCFRHIGGHIYGGFSAFRAMVRVREALINDEKRIIIR